MNTMMYTEATFLKSAAKVNQLPEDIGVEVAFAGRSNAGKSSAINCLTGIKQLARTSKTPGRTRLMNCFVLQDELYRLIDLPGYGYAKVSHAMKREWQAHLAHYFEVRKSLKGLVVLMDIRHPLMPLDQSMVEWALGRDLPVHVLLTKADKISRSQAQSTVFKVQKHYAAYENLLSVQMFSSLKRQGLDVLHQVLDAWYLKVGE
ncbi:MAG: ribosome biogenesis GTP-binding protein YihA/YsxC [Gammaproteobacteria bacterium]|nr:ribosome biogenesis GTP-binding protein YihA/YsxC [Gammaproteobacteria bacterium]